MNSPALPDSSVKSTMDGEHRVQAGLINALCRAVEEGKPAAEVAQILAQLVDYSEVHFLSEELLMRLDSYEDLDEHVADHILMMEALQAMVRDQRAGKSGLIAAQARGALAFLQRHIETRDAHYAASPRV